MTASRIDTVPAHRLKQELLALGIDHIGPRADLVSRLRQAGVYEIHKDLPAQVAKLDRTARYPNHSSVLIGYGAFQENNIEDNTFVVSNKKGAGALIHGNFIDGKVTIKKCFALGETTELDPDVYGEEGDLRRIGANLYMYRNSDVHPGWYPLLFGSVMLV